MNAPDSAEYPHMASFFGPVRDRAIMALPVHGDTPDAELIAAMQDGFERELHVVLCARTEAGLNAAVEVAKHLAQHTPALTRN